MNRRSVMLQTVFLSYVVLLTALLVHEGIHLVVLHLLGVGGSMIVVPWRLASINYYIYGLHVQHTGTLSLFQQALFDFLGPALASVPFGLLAFYVKEKIPMTALVANVIILIFFAALETLYEFLESTLQREIGIFGSPEFNIGVPLLIILIVAYEMVWKDTK